MSEEGSLLVKNTFLEIRKPAAGRQKRTRGVSDTTGLRLVTEELASEGLIPFATVEEEGEDAPAPEAQVEPPESGAPAPPEVPPAVGSNGDQPRTKGNRKRVSSGSGASRQWHPEMGAGPGGMPVPTGQMPWGFPPMGLGPDGAPVGWPMWPGAMPPWASREWDEDAQSKEGSAAAAAAAAGYAAAAQAAASAAMHSGGGWSGGWPPGPAPMWGMPWHMPTRDGEEAGKESGPRKRRGRGKKESKQAAITTLNMRNVPRVYTQQLLLEELFELGFKHSMDFFYLPVDFRQGRSAGYCFVNFTTATAAERFQALLQGSSLARSDASDPPIEICPARKQGLSENVDWFRNSPVMQEDSDEVKPVLLDPRTGSIMAFPAPSGPVRRRNVQKQRALAVPEMVGGVLVG
uniref:RRM domain-containing protein n=1 Tax=Oxyrrhis marina TaxID=2969 RepID=A0A7S4LQD9_OXYMA